MHGLKSSIHSSAHHNCITKAEEEAYFYYTMSDLESLLTQYGGDFIVEHCKIDDMKLFGLYEALAKHYGARLK